MLFRGLMVVSMCVACAPGSAARDPSLDGSAEEVAGDEDSDGDGLCDSSELALGTDRSRADSDGDGLLDVHEQIAGTDPRDRLDPSPDRVALLQAGGRLDFAISLAVDQSGAAVRGELKDRNALDPQERRAGDFFRGSSAREAVPPENVRNVESGRARFASVLGRTQLTFALRFAAEADAALDCAAVLPFDYAATLDDGSVIEKQRVLLVVAKDATPPAAEDFCRPVACL